MGAEWWGRVQAEVGLALCLGLWRLNQDVGPPGPGGVGGVWLEGDTAVWSFTFKTQKTWAHS